MALKIGDKAPVFKLLDQAGKTHSLTQYQGQWVLLYVYPKDMTPGCTIEACTIRDNYSGFKKLKAVVLGISGDSSARHEKFATKHELPFPLLADEDRMVLKAYGALKPKSMFGKTFLGIIRMSFLIDPKGKIAKIYPKVKPAEHAEEVLKDLKELKK